MATELLKNSDNYIALQRTFFPPDNYDPDFVIVKYVYDVGKLEHEGNASEEVWFWSVSAYFFYHPLQVFQCTSLGFSDLSIKQSDITLHLPASCYQEYQNNDSYYMQLLTQRVS